MRRFFASAWFPFVTSLLFAISATAAYALLSPTGLDVHNDQIVRIFGVASWATGAVAGLLSFILMMILNGIRRIVKLRTIRLLHPVVVLLGILPWLLLGWQLVMNEPRFTPIARAIIDFVGVPMLWGALVSTAFTLLAFLILLIPSRSAR